MQWFKFYGQDFLTDSKIGALNPLQKLMWTALLCVASQDEERTGIIKFLTEDRLMDLCGIRIEDFENMGMKHHVTLVTFCNMGLITMPDKDTIIITNFYKKQRQQTTSAERVRAYRERKKNVTDVTNVMLQGNGRVDKNRVDISNPSKTHNKKLVPCTEEQLLRVSKDLEVSIEDIKRTHEIILNKIASGEFKGKTVYFSLRNWILMGIERGNIKKKEKYSIYPV